MSNVQNPTYFLAPNWNFHPGGRIAIGNIIVNPLKPHLPLSKANPANPPKTDFSREKNWRLSLETATNINVSLWTVFLEKINITLSANRERIRNRSFTMSSLETTYLAEDPTPAEIKARCNDPDVKEFMRLDSVLCKPVYMISGIKIAKDFRLEGENSLTRGAAVEAGGEVATEASVGGSVGIQHKDRIADEFESDGDIIFAYQLIKIKPKGWSKEKTLNIEEYQHKQAFLGDEEKEEDVEVEGELEEFTQADLEDLDKANVVEVDGAAVAYAPPRAKAD